MRDEEAKIRCEQQLLNRQVPVNMQPDFARNMGMTNQGYTNPFAATGILGMGTGARTSKAVNIIPPLVAELTDYNLGGELDSSSDFMDFENSYRKRRQQIDLLIRLELG